MFKKKLSPTTVSFQIVVEDRNLASDVDEIVIRLSEVSLLYIRNGLCYLQTKNRDTPYQLPVSDYKRVRKAFVGKE